MHVSRRSFLRAAAALVLTTATGCGANPTATQVPAPVPVPPTATPAVLLPSTPAPVPDAPPTAPSAATPASTPTRQPSPPAAPQPASTLTRQPSPPAAAGEPDIAVARGDSPEKTTRAAIAALGGIGRFVKPGNDVIIKPNCGPGAFGPEYADMTNPEVVAALVTLCREAGAKRVRVMDSPFQGTDGNAYAVSGIQDAVKRAGGEMELMARMKFQDTAIPNGKDLKTWPIYQDVLKADVFITVPIAKTHNMARLTLGMKNQMGVILDRGQIHYNMGQRLADLATVLRPTLVVIDAVRILTQGGPTGGNLAWVKKLDTVIATRDIVAADAYGATLFGMKGDDLDYVRAAAAMGLGRKDIENLKIERIAV
jgi:uncharacterized protein (DUF362 family)